MLSTALLAEVDKPRDIPDGLEYPRSFQACNAAGVVSGPYDIIAIIERDDLGSISDMVTGQLHTIAGITRSVTCLRIQ